MLEQAGYIEVKKGYIGERARTWLTLSPVGRAAYATHLAALTEIANPVPTPSPDRESAPP